MTARAPITRIDWWQIFEDLRGAGFSIYQVAGFTGIPKGTLMGYKNADHEPDHWRGELLLTCWAQGTQRSMVEAPRKVLAVSVSVARR